MEVVHLDDRGIGSLLAGRDRLVHLAENKALAIASKGTGHGTLSAPKTECGLTWRRFVGVRFSRRGRKAREILRFSSVLVIWPGPSSLS